MKPVFIDFHIHTSGDPNKPNQNYEIEILKQKIEEIADGDEFLISLTDHNFVNKTAYLKAVKVIDNLLLGAELHVRNFPEANPYHCHILFNCDEITGEVIDDVNEKLDVLYPNKRVGNSDKSIPKLEDIINCFDDYDFIVMPHGGQNHSTFDKSIPEGKKFDRSLERSIYYNHFDGFTARSNRSIEKTLKYFKRIGIEGIVNLVTATDNYFPKDYPDGRAGRKAHEFTPTWMLAEPTFNGLRVSLSESSRLIYGDKPNMWAECIHRVELKNDHIDIDVTLTPGLNVVIGGSSSGKSLLVDSIYRQIKGDFSNSNYLETPFKVEDLYVDNPAAQEPHYLNQNYIVKVCDSSDSENNLENIEILKNVFPSDRESAVRIQNGLVELHEQLDLLVDSVDEIEKLQNSLKKIPILSQLIVREEIHGNPIKEILPSDQLIESIEYNEALYDKDIRVLDKIDERLTKNPLISNDRSLIEKLKQELLTTWYYADLEVTVRNAIEESENELDSLMAEEDKELTSKRKNFEKLLGDIKRYIRYSNQFLKSLERIAQFEITIDSNKVLTGGHTLFIDNAFKLTQESILEVINETRKKPDQLPDFLAITPEALFKKNFKQKDPKITNYDEFKNHIKNSFNKMNSKTYRIVTSEGKEFSQLSAGWKTSIILDLILGWEEDNAPLIIDQPEDNLAMAYMNDGLIKAIKKSKTNKQIILVSHNATIPMLGDAQNVIMCKNTDNKIRIRANPLESSIDGDSVIDLIANATEGGKSSIRKRVKKYNLKDFRG